MHVRPRHTQHLLVSTLGSFALLLSAGGCATEPAPAPAPTGHRPLATVNGVSISEADALHWLASKSNVRERDVSAEQIDQVLVPIIRLELLAQRAVELGLDQDADFQRQLETRQAAVDAFRRDALAEKLYAKETVARATVSVEQARAYFEANQERIRSQYHVHQILKGREADIRAIKTRLEQGESFDAVVAEQFPGLAEGAKKPWDLGYLRWPQLPDAWREVAERLEVGAPSDVIRGPGRRFWIIRVVAKREDPAITFENTKQALITALTAERTEQASAELDAELRQRARIVYAREGGKTP